MIVVIDNYDSFVYNLARYIKHTGEVCTVVRNDQITIEQVQNLHPKAIVISPGPCTPQESGICIELIRAMGESTPILGVCLGHQAIADAYGDQTLHAQKPMHGKATTITHNGEDIFNGLPKTFKVGRYHSLAVKLRTHSPLRATAFTKDDGEIMALRHSTFPVYGVQFHPESIITEHGQTMINNFIDIVERHQTNLNKTEQAA